MIAMRAFNGRVDVRARTPRLRSRFILEFDLTTWQRKGSQQPILAA